MPLIRLPFGRLFWIVSFASCFGLPGQRPLAAAVVTIHSAAGLSARLDQATGHYALAAAEPAWTLGGELGGAPREVMTTEGRDRIGAYQELRFTVPAAGGGVAAFRLYDGRPVALCTIVSGGQPAAVPVTFPRFTSVPAGLHHFSHGDDDTFAPPRFRLEQTGTPWLLFDDRADALVISPADHFLLARMTGDGGHEIASGLNPGVHDLPARFGMATLVAFGRGIDETWTTWGDALTRWLGRHAPANDADPGLRYLGYWTDNGAFYYYNYDPALGYAGTLASLVRHYRERRIPIRYLQLDSWWYRKSFTDPGGRTGHAMNPRLPAGEWNRYGGMMRYEADPALFPDGLAAFQRSIGLPLITHNRWIDPASPDHERYRMAGFAAIDPAWWRRTAGYLAEQGVVAYEQDWLNVIYAHSPELATTAWAGDAFTDGMARAAAARGLSLQYCMALPRFFLQGARYDNLTTIRVSDDRFERKRWDAFLYTSRLARALGIWPWSDVFMSTETDNLLLADLSAGMVGIGDEIGKESAENLAHVARPDGVLVKPDESIHPVDAMYLADATGRRDPMVAWAHTDHGTRRTAYVFAYARTAEKRGTGFTPAEFGFDGDVCVVNARTGEARFQRAGDRCAFALAGDETAYHLVVPAEDGFALVGDAGQYAAAGRQRIAAVDPTADGLAVRVMFAAGEKSVTLFGYARSAPRVTARSGGVGAVDFDAKSGRFTVEVTPAADIRPGCDPTQVAEVKFQTAPSP